MSNTIDEPPICRFSTEDFSPAQRLEAWQELFGRKFMRVDTTPLSDAPFKVETSTQKLPGLTLALARTWSPMRVARTPALLDDGLDGIKIVIPTTNWTACQFEREFALESGDAALFSTAAVCATITPTASSVACQILPRDALPPRLLNKGSALFGRIRRDNEALRLLRRYLSHLWREPLRAPELRAAAVAHVYDLVALALGANRDAAEAAKRGGLAAARRQAAKAYILAHLGRAGLTLAEVAKQQNVSPRYLRMLFDSEGETFTQFVREHRLQRAYRLLTSPLHIEARISAIVYECGFGDLSHFNRAFRRRFGATPSDIRAQSKT